MNTRMSDNNSDRTVEKLLRQQAALAAFGSFAFREPDLDRILTEAARICAGSLGVRFCKICRYRPEENDLLIEAGCGWHAGVVGRVVSQANESSPQGRAYVTGEPVIIRNLLNANDLKLPDFYQEHGIISTVDVLIPAIDGVPYGVLEIDSPEQHQYDVHDINFLTGFANVLAEAVATARRVREIKALLASQSLLAEELQHRVRNNLHMITSMLDSYASKVTEGSAREGIELITRRVTTLAQVYDSLLGVGLSKTIDLSAYLAALCLSLPGLQKQRTGEVKLTYEAAENVLLGLDQVTSLGMVVAELVTNCYKHAFPDRDGIIAITLAHPSLEPATLTIQDDGIGYNTAVRSSGHGASLTKRLLSRMGGTIVITDNNGTLCTIVFPVPVTSGGGRMAA